MTATCHHCGAPVAEQPLTAMLEGKPRPVCSSACQSTAEWIDGRGLTDYYRLRRGPSHKPDADAGADTEAWRDPRLARHVLRPLSGKRSEVCLLVDGIRCGGCAWLIERTLKGLPGVQSVQVNAMTRRTRIVFEPQRTPLPRLLEALASAGYQPRPLDARALDDARRDESRQLLKRLLVAGFGMMQAMMFALVLYLGPDNEIQGATLALFRWLGFLVASPVVLYSARPFFAGALQAWRGRHLNMDVPIALAIAVIYSASFIQCLLGGAEVYFDSVTMLIFFLLTGRYLEMRARHRALDHTDALARLTPSWAEKLDGNDQPQRVALNELVPGDRVRVRDGGSIPADGVLLDSRARIDESLLSGESRPVEKRAGDKVIAGSVVQGQAILLQVTHCGEDTFLANLAGLATRAQTERPRLARAGEKTASRFVLRVLGLTVLTAMVWATLDPSRLLDACLAVLVVSCPCAFALAVPAAITRSLSVLARQGVLVLRPDGLEILAGVDRAVFDKTGTLTEPSVSVTAVDDSIDPDTALLWAASLSDTSEHPLSRAFANGNARTLLPTQHARVLPGLGITGTIAGRALRLGRGDFATGGGEGQDDLVLAEDGRTLARFQVHEKIRADARELIDSLAAQGIESEILSGDAQARVAEVASQLGVSAWRGRCLPADKLARIGELRRAGHRVLVVGDGSNDAPVLAGADVSIALSSGSDLAQAQADIVLCSGRLVAIAESRAVARTTLRVLAQNQRWALSYNLCAMPLAAIGWVPPWLAAIGMSTSSLVVVLNALRIDRKRTTTDPVPVSPEGARV